MLNDLCYEGELFRDGMLTSLKIKKIPYEMIEVTFRKTLKNDKGEIISDNYYTMFYSTNEFVDFFLPLINHLKVRIENDPEFKGQ